MSRQKVTTGVLEVVFASLCGATLYQTWHMVYTLYKPDKGYLLFEIFYFYFFYKSYVALNALKYFFGLPLTLSYFEGEFRIQLDLFRTLGPDYEYLFRLTCLWCFFFVLLWTVKFVSSDPNPSSTPQKEEEAKVKQL